jgi:HK97 family phage prohead protease
MSTKTKKPYGDVQYADPGYQDDGVKRYPLDSESHVRAAWSYINMPKNARKYSPAELAKVKGRIKAAARKFGIEISEDRASQLVVMTRAVDVAELEIRSDGRTLEGTIVPYGQSAHITEYGKSYVEVFHRGAFAGERPAAVPLTRLHPRSGAELPIGVGVEFADDGIRLRGAFHVSDIPEGNEVLQLARDKVPLGFSVGFVDVQSRWIGRDRVERLRANLDHVAVVRSPAYREALVTAVRGAQSRTEASTPLLGIARLRR